MKTYLISEDLLTAIHNYLLLRPMREVEVMVLGLRSCESAATETGSLPDGNAEAAHHADPSGN